MKKAIIAVSLLMPFISFAHDGHGGTGGFTITHYFVEPQHAVFTWSFIMAGVIIAFFRVKKQRATK